MCDFLGEESLPHVWQYLRRYSPHQGVVLDFVIIIYTALNFFVTSKLETVMKLIWILCDKPTQIQNFEEEKVMH